MLEPLLTLDDAARLLKMSRSWVEGQIRSGRLKQTKLGKMVRIEPADLRAFLDSFKGVSEIVPTPCTEASVTVGLSTIQVVEKGKVREC